MAGELQTWSQWLTINVRWTFGWLVNSVRWIKGLARRQDACSLDGERRELDTTVANMSPAKCNVMELPRMIREKFIADKSTFVKTEGYLEVREELYEYSDHILICGSPGSGKTTTSLMLMDWYRRKRRFNVFFVDNLIKFNPFDEIDINIPTLVVLDDVFGKFSQTNELIDCTKTFDYLDKHFKQLESRPKLKVIMNSRTNIWNDVQPQLLKYRKSLFKESSIRYLMTSIKLKTTEKEKMLRKHLNEKTFSLIEPDLDAITSLEYSTLGFPYICQLYADNDRHYIPSLEFFEKPFKYLVDLISVIFSKNQSRHRAAVLLMMMLNDGSLNLMDLLDLEQRNETGLEEMRIKAGIILSESSSAEQIHEAAKSENKTLLLSEGDVMKFSHPTIHDAVAFVVGSKNPVFVIENCSLHFVLERTKLEVDNTPITPSGGDFNSFTIRLGPSAAPYVVKRLAKELVAGNIAMPLSHPCFLSEAVVNLLFERLTRLEKLDACLHHSIDKVYGLRFLFWACYVNPGPLCQLCFQKTQYDFQELLEGCMGCCMSGHIPSLKSLIAVCKDDTSNIKRLISITVGDILRCDENPTRLYRSLSTVSSPRKDQPLVKETVRMHGNNADTLIHISAANGFVEVVSYLLDMKTDIDIRGGNKMTALMHACYLGYSDMVHMLIERGANSELLDEEGDNCLHLACRGGHPDIIQMLIGKKMNVNQRGEHERTPLMYAAYNGHEDATRLLLNNGAETELDVSQLYNKENSLHLACVKGHTSVVRILIEKGNIDTECPGQRNRTPLMYACRNGNLETAKILAEKGADMKVLDNDKFTCLHLAAMKGNLDTVKWLLSSGSVSTVDCLNKINRTPLMFAMKSGNEDTVNYLIKKRADILKGDIIDTTNLHFAVQSGVLQLVDLCLENGININVTNTKGMTPIKYACQKCSVELMNSLIERGADFNQDDSLVSACFGGNMEMVSYLIKRFPDLDIDKASGPGRTPIMVAVLGGHVDLVDYLHGLEANISLRDKFNDTLLHLCCRSLNIKLVSKILELRQCDVNAVNSNNETPATFAIKSNFPDALYLLMHHGANLNFRDVYGGSYLHSACWFGVEKTCRKLLDLGADVNARNRKQETPVMNLVKSSRNQSGVLSLLMERGADINAKTVRGDTCLHAAAKFGKNLTTIQTLLENGVDINARGEHGRTHVMCAASEGNRAAVELLIAKEADLSLIDEAGWTCCHHALQGGHQELADYLSHHSRTA